MPGPCAASMTHPLASIRDWTVQGDLSIASSQVAVGVGTLAGSTIMLLTIVWGGSLLVGRCDIVGVREPANPQPSRLPA